MTSVASAARTIWERERAVDLQRERNLPRPRRAAARWNELAIGIFNLGLSRKRWALVGNWLHLCCPDKSLQRYQRRWWHIVGEELKVVKARGKAVAAPRQRAAPAPAPPPAPEPEPEDEEEEPEWQPAGPGWGLGAAPQVNVQVHINVQNAQPAEPAAHARGGRQGGRAAAAYGRGGAAGGRGRGRR